MKSVPRQLTIRGVDYNIKTKPRLSVNTPEAGKLEVMGVVDGDHGEIIIEKNVPLKMQWRTLVHEVVHAMFRGYYTSDDEFFVDVIAGEIYGLLKQLGAI